MRSLNQSSQLTSQMEMKGKTGTVVISHRDVAGSSKT
jgi:hypothetical protein